MYLVVAAGLCHRAAFDNIIKGDSFGERCTFMRLFYYYWPFLLLCNTSSLKTSLKFKPIKKLCRFSIAKNGLILDMLYFESMAMRKDLSP
jgi:hypothetical protein